MSFKLATVFVLAIAVSANKQQTNENYTPTTPSNPNPPSGGYYGAAPPSNPQYCHLVNGVNQYRAQNGLSPLVGDSRLDDAAKVQCNAMAAYNNLDHSADGSRLGDRIEQAGYNWGGVAENIYNESGYGATDQQRALDGWINSAGHRANLLGDYTSVGHASCKTGNTVYWSQDFAKGSPEPAYQYSCGGDYEHKEPTYNDDNNEEETYTKPEPKQEIKEQEYKKEEEEYEEAPPAPVKKEEEYKEAPPAPVKKEEEEYKEAPPAPVKKEEEYKEAPPAPESKTVPEAEVKYGKHGKPCKKTTYGKKSPANDAEAKPYTAPKSAAYSGY
ncbi:hypothetical protein HK099_000754 [Clydaea vesicula]|uniref:SCP domain-containing protein n=1 Tax=Clydaea vesicula TaxID=447962 RepID=A0AAD5Y231_9FUNG|nr:hypothetical protein HK099_000754 [Clydaea vesicula]